MANPEELLRLAEKVEGAKGADRALDGEVGCALYPDRHPHSDGYAIGLGSWKPWPSYTSSLDAVTALIREKLPAMHGGWEWRVQSPEPSGPECVAYASVKAVRVDAEAWAATAELALLSAFLRALATQEKNHGG